jgi:hypothetical protein
MADPTDNDAMVEQAIRQMEVAANNVAVRLAKSAGVRAAYVREIKEMSDAMWAAYQGGKLTAAKAAELANQQRNVILEMARANDLDFGRAYAQSLKKTGMELDKVITYVMNEKAGFKERFAGKAFSTLTDSQKTEIYEEVIKSAGRNRTAVTQTIPRLRWAARGLWVATAAIAIYNIGTAEDPWWQAGREGANVGGGLLGSIAGGAAMGAAGGVWAGPIGVGVGVLVGGILGAVLADHAYVEAAGTSDPRVRDFVGRFTSFLGGTDESGMADALVNEYAGRTHEVLRVFNALEHDYSSDSDDIAYEYVTRLKSRPDVARAVKSDVALRNKLVGLLSSGFVSAGERQAAAWLKAP